MKQEDARAQLDLGVIYDEGYRVPKDDKTALKWNTLAADHGNSDAQCRLGQMHRNGGGVLKDYVYAQMWGSIAAESKNTWSDRVEDGIKLWDLFGKEMTPSQLEIAQDLARECVRKKYKEC